MYAEKKVEELIKRDKRFKRRVDIIHNELNLGQHGKTLNKVLLVGRLGQDPEIRHSQDGNAIASFSIATNESWRDKEKSTRKNPLAQLRCFWPTAEKYIQPYVTKGTLVVLREPYKPEAGKTKRETQDIQQGCCKPFWGSPNSRAVWGRQQEATNESRTPPFQKKTPAKNKDDLPLSEVTFSGPRNQIVRSI